MSILIGNDRLNMLVCCIILFLICGGCSNSQQEIAKHRGVNVKLFVSIDDPKITLSLDNNGTFIYTKISRKSDPNELFYITSGIWSINGTEISLNSKEDSTYNKDPLVIKKSLIDSTYSTFRFYDILKDSVGFMYVIYPNTRKYSQGSDMGDQIFDWIEDMSSNEYLEFHFVNYVSWRYSSEGRNYNFDVYLKPIYRANLFVDEKFLLKGDTLTRISNFRKYVYLKDSIVNWVH